MLMRIIDTRRRDPSVLMRALAIVAMGLTIFAASPVERGGATNGPAGESAESVKHPTNVRRSSTSVGDTTVVFEWPLSYSMGGSGMGIQRIAIPIEPGAQYLLRVVNGNENGGSRWSDGNVVMNSDTVVSSSEIRTGPTVITKEVAVHAADTIIVHFAGTGSEPIVFVLTLLSTADPHVTLLGSKTYVRKNANSSFTDTFIVPPGVGAPFALYVQNGDSTGMNRAVGGTIKLNGAT